jgi:hypothetical protein
MNKPHKWAKEIKAWADGAEIEIRYDESNGYSEWEIEQYPNFNSDLIEVRIKPTPKEPQYLYVYKRDNWIGLSDVKPSSKDEMYIGKIKLENEE